MSFTRPTIDQLIDRIKTDIKDGLSLTTVLRRSFVGVIARALAGASHLVLGYLDWIKDQAFPDTAEKEYLERWSQIWGVLRKEATFAEITVLITGNEGGVVPINTIFQRSDGVQYYLKAEVTIPLAGSIAGTVVAVSSGSLSNLAVDDVISLLSPIADVDSDATVTAVAIVAEDTESDDAFRARLIDRIQLPPLGGSANDYIQWALSIAGVTRAWVLPLYTGAGTVGVSFVTDDSDPIIPTGAKVTEVDDYIQEVKPVTAIVTTFAPVAAPMTIDIDIKPNTAAVQAAVTAELEDILKRDASLAGAYKTPSTTYDGSILLSKINQAVSLAVGIEDHVINTINGVAPANVVPSTGELVTLGTITWHTLA